jgi:hypothetical protein
MRSILSLVLAAMLSMTGRQTMAQQPDTAQTSPQASTAETHVAMVQDDASLETLRTRLIGEWEEFSPSRNYVDFLADGRVVLYLKKSEIGDLKTVYGQRQQFFRHGHAALRRRADAVNERTRR